MTGLRTLFQNISGGLIMAGETHGEIVFRRVSLKEYILWFQEHNPDILALCEAHMEDAHGHSEMVETIAKELDFLDYRCYSQSPSHLDTSKYMGIAVLSKYKIEHDYPFC